MAVHRLADGREFGVGDTVFFRIGADIHQGQIVKLLPNTAEVRVRYRDHQDRANADPAPVKTRTISIVDLCRRRSAAS